jgi:hypothetical protein
VPRPYFSLDAPGSGSATTPEPAASAARLAASATDWQRRRDARARVRTEFAEARTHGLAARHATKLTRLRTARLLAELDATRAAAVSAPAGPSSGSVAGAPTRAARTPACVEPASEPVGVVCAAGSSPALVECAPGPVGVAPASACAVGSSPAWVEPAPGPAGVASGSADAVPAPVCSAPAVRSARPAPGLACSVPVPAPACSPPGPARSSPSPGVGRSPLCRPDARTHLRQPAPDRRAWRLGLRRCSPPHNRSLHVGTRRASAESAEPASPVSWATPASVPAAPAPCRPGTTSGHHLRAPPPGTTSGRHLQTAACAPVDTRPHRRRTRAVRTTSLTLPTRSTNGGSRRWTQNGAGVTEEGG